MSKKYEYKGFTRKLRKFVKERDEFCCQTPFMYCDGPCVDRIEIHHIDYNKKNFRDDNVILLCAICHERVKQDRDFWQEIYFDIAKENNARVKRNAA